MPVNPFVELVRDPVTTLSAFAYVLVLFGVSIQLAGRGWEWLLWLDAAWEKRHREGDHGPRWNYVPPSEVYNRVTVVILLLAVEFALWGGIVYVIT